MKHPDQAALALYAGGDLGLFANCERCGEEVASFGAMREIVTDLTEIPDVPWNGLAAEMKANIRLGLVAGECVRLGETPLRERPLFTGVRAAVALASIVTLAVTGLMLEPHARQKVDQQHTVAQGIHDGIELGEGERAFRLMNTGATNVTLSAGADCSVGARYLDPNTGQVTVNRVYE
jgi:hypothetical protein